MQLKHKITYSILFSMLISCNVYAEQNIDPTFSTDIVKTQELQNNNEFKKNFSSTINKFENLNIKIAYDDFSKLIEKNKDNDFYLLLIADKTAELGFFDLSELAFNSTKDKDISNTNYQDIKKFYYPKVSMSKEDILILAELSSNILYNDQSKESVNELSQYQRYLKDYDYANYLMALGYFKLNDINNAKKYIDSCIKHNPNNINYRILEAKILAGEKKGKYSKKIIKDIKSQQITTASLLDKINSAEEFILYLTSQKSFDKNFHLGMYYFCEKNYTKSARIFQTSLSNKNKKDNAKLYSMLARCSFEQGDYIKTQEYIKKTNKITKNNPNCLLTMGDLKAKEGDLKSALKYYKQISSHKPLKQLAEEKKASVYSKLSGSKRSNDLYKNIIKEYPNSYIAYYKLGLDSENQEIEYLKKALSLNIMYQDAWIDLARIMIENGNINFAKNCLVIANYLDDKNYRYYYYQNLLKTKETSINNSQKNIINRVANETQHFNSRRP